MSSFKKIWEGMHTGNVLPEETTDTHPFSGIILDGASPQLFSKKILFGEARVTVGVCRDFETSCNLICI